MSKKIKLTDKDLEIRINNNKSHYNQTCVFENESPQNDPTSVLACDATSVHVTCECATYPSNCFCNTTYCLTNNQTCDCVTKDSVCVCNTNACPPGGTGGGQDTGGCVDPLTHATQCGVCQTGDCNQTNTCTCNESRYCDTINCLETGKYCESIYQVCETEGINCYDTGADCLGPESDNCDIITTECEETEICAESYNCLYTELCVGSDNVSCETKCMNC